MKLLLLLMMRLEAMHGESKAAICGDLEAEGAYARKDVFLELPSSDLAWEMSCCWCIHST